MKIRKSIFIKLFTSYIVSAVLMLLITLIFIYHFVHNAEIIIVVIISINTLILIFIKAYLFNKYAYKSIRELINVSNEIVKGNFNSRIFFRNDDELKELGDNFNNIVLKIENLLNQISNQKEELSTIIESIQVMLVVMDNKGKILLSNNRFKDIVACDNIEGFYYWNSFRDLALGEIIINVKKEGNIVVEKEIKDRIYLINAGFLKAKQQIAIIFSDITEIKRLEKIKKDFVVNVSHELKTPLTVIKGFVETMLENNKIDYNNQHYLNIIQNNTDRLINIVKDLLLLSEMENGKFKLTITKIDIKNLIKDIISIFEYKLNKKNLYVKTIIKDGISIIDGDSFKLEQILINLISNSIKYTEKGGIKIIVEYSKTNHNKINIIIQDTGIGIANCHIDRIFERFYVIDKSRSRKTGGTGLGLSIVKHIVLLHNGNIYVDSIIDKGTTFTIELPIKQK